MATVVEHYKISSEILNQCDHVRKPPEKAVVGVLDGATQVIKHGVPNDFASVSIHSICSIDTNGI